MKEALLYEKLPRQAVRCSVCQRRCVIAEGKWGYCKTRVNRGGKLYTSIYGLVSSLNLDPIEKKPVFHYQPGSGCFSLGTWGCNFRCRFCQNWEIAFADAAKLTTDNSQPTTKSEEVVSRAIKSGTEGIAITYNEPTIWLEYSLDIFKRVKSLESRVDGLYTVWVTNGYATPEAIDLIAPYLDVYRVDLKSFDDKFYQKLINVPKAAPVFQTTAYLHRKYPKIHLECVTNIVPGWNDDTPTLKKLAVWVKENLGSKTPWHITRFFPDAKLTDVPATPPEILFKARGIGFEEGLEFVYIGNLQVDSEDDTFCPKCRRLAIRRQGYSTEVLGVDGKGNCRHCGENLNIVI